MTVATHPERHELILSTEADVHSRFYLKVIILTLLFLEK